MSKFRISATAATALLVSMSPSGAATTIGEHFTIGGFGTLGGVLTDSDEGQFGRDRQPGGADKDPSYEVDSNLGIQLTGTATKWLSGTIQVLAAKRDEDNIQAKVEWAYVLVKPIDRLSIRAGRMALPAFAISDSRNIGYANTWVRAPNEVYALNVLRNFTGVDASYPISLGSTTLNLTALAGKPVSTISFGQRTEGDKLRGINLLLETDWATFRLGQLNLDASVPTAGVYGDPYRFKGIGVTVEREKLVAQAEYVQRRSAKASTLVDANGWYVMGGWRFGTLLPYAIVGRTAPVNGGSPVYLSATQKSKALGLRWDAFASAAIKFQIDHIDTENTAGISFTTPSLAPAAPGLPASRQPVQDKVNALSVAVDFTY